MNKKIILQWNQLQGKMAGHAWHGDGSESWTPNTDICEGPDFAVIRMELPGVTRENLEIAIDEDILMVRGVRPDPACEESAAGYRFRQLEIEYGNFQRAIKLPYAVDGANTEAQLKNGILDIRVPRAPSAGETKIDVIAES